MAEPRVITFDTREARFERAGLALPNCCCRWGAAVGNRGHGPSGEVPEDPCDDCPIPGHDIMSTGKRVCRRHRREREAVQQ